MRIQVVNVINRFVQVKSEIGFFQGIMYSDREIEKREYSIELDSDDILTIESVRYASTSQFSIKSENDKICITGKVVKIEEQIMFLCIQKTVMMLEIDRQSVADLLKYVNHFVEIYLKSIVIYDVDV